VRTSAPQPGSEVVLVVEDEATVLDIACGFLTRLGYRTVAARDAEEALIRLREHPEVDLLFTDVSLPDMDGVSLAIAARALRPDIAVVYTSANLSSAALDRLHPEERAAVLAKPYRREGLAYQLRTALSRRAASA
jgi:CheY-like chemotaxis protein